MTIRVLLADDHKIVRDGLRALLEREPDILVVGDVANGSEAVRQVELLHPHVVVMDIAMPDMNGLDATQRVRQVSPGTQVVILSMYSTAEHLNRALRAGALGYVLKESAGSEVVTAIRTVHMGQHHLSPGISETMIAEYLQQRQNALSTDPFERLSANERRVLQHVVEGKSSAAIAAVLGLSPKTVETYRSRLMRKLGVADLPSLIRFAIQNGLTGLQ
jgi:DNA-binding NarL/FixJ family response regulator